MGSRPCPGAATPAQGEPLRSGLALTTASCLQIAPGLTEVTVVSGRTWRAQLGGL